MPHTATKLSSSDHILGTFSVHFVLPNLNRSVRRCDIETENAASEIEDGPAWGWLETCRDPVEPAPTLLDQTDGVKNPHMLARRENITADNRAHTMPKASMTVMKATNFSQIQ